jgi:hypothetical protein
MTNKEIQKTALRLPRELHSKILLTAAESGRSMNAEIVYRLQTSYEGSGPTHELIKRLMALDLNEISFEDELEKTEENLKKSA